MIGNDVLKKIFDIGNLEKDLISTFECDQRIFKEDNFGNSELMKVIHNNIRVKLHKERTKDFRFLDIEPDIGSSFLVSISLTNGNIPCLIEKLESGKTDMLIDLTDDEVELYLERFSSMRS